jgi:hypothetical protein
MTQELINIGTLPNDGTGDPVRVAFQKINNNFSQVFNGNTFSQIYGPEGSVQFKRVNNLQAVALKGDVYLLTGSPSRFYTSTDLVDFTLNPNPPTSNTIYSLITASGNFWGVGEGGTVVTSNNGVIWANAIQTSVTDTLRDIAYDSSNTRFVTVGDNGRILYSTNGANWTLQTSGTTENLNGVTFADSLGFVTVGSNGTALYSTNGTVWNVANTTVTEELYSITYNGALFTAVGANGTIITSNLLATWSDRTTPNVTVDLYSVTSANVSGNLTFITVGENGVVYQSTDANAVIWTPQTNPIAQNLVDVTIAGNTFIATGANSAVINLGFGNSVWANVSVPARLDGSANFLYDDPKSNINIAANIIPQSGANVTLGTANNRFASGFFDSIEANVVTSNLTLSNIQVTGSANLGNVSNVTIFGGDNGYFLQTDGAGNLTWAPAGNGGGGGNGSPAGANTQVQFNDQGNFGGDAGFTYNKVSNVLSVNTVTSFNQTISNNLTVSNTLTTLIANVTGNLKSGNANLGNLVTANYINVVWDVSANVVYSNYVYGDGSNLTNLPPVSNANYANTSNVANSANTANTANIANVAYSVSGANVVGDVSGANTANIANIANVAYSVSGANVSGTVANATYALFAGTAYSVSGANVTGTVANANYANIAGTAYAVSGANVSGEVANANYASYSDVANSADTANIADTANVAYSVDGANVVGEVANSNYSNFANFAFNVNGVNVSGTVANANYSEYAGTAYAVDGANVSGIVANANFASFSNVANSANTANVATSATSANTAGTVTTAAQPNITSVGNLTSLDIVGALNAASANVSGNGSFGNLSIVDTLHVGNAFFGNANSTLTAYGNVNFEDSPSINLGEVNKIIIEGGSANYFLKTDGAGNLSWSAVPNGGGNTSPGGSNTQVQFNNGGVFDGNSAFTFDVGTSTLAVSGQVNATTISATGNLAVGNATLGNLAIANFFQGSGNRLSNIVAANITGTVANANYSVYAEYANIGNVTNGTSNVAIPVTNGNINLSAAGNANVLVVTGTGANVTGTLRATGNANVGNIGATNGVFTNVTGTLTTNAQPNITSVGNLSVLYVDTGVWANTANFEGNGSFGNLQVVGSANIGTELTVNNGGVLNVFGDVYFDDATEVNLGEVYKIKIWGGSNGYVLTTDGTGNLSWTAGGNGGGGGNATPGGSNTQVQFNDNGSFGGNAAFTFDKTTGALTVNGHISGTTLGITGNIAVGNASLGVIAQAGIFSGSGNQLSNIQAANITGTIANANYSTFAGTVITGAQPNITSVGTLNGLQAVGNTSLSNLIVTGNVIVGQRLSMNANSNLTTIGTVHFANSPNVDMPNIANIHIPGGTNGYFLQTDGTGNLTWAAAGGGGGNGSPGGGNRQVQFNDNGVFGGSPLFTFDKTASNLTVAGNLIANTLTIGSGIFQFSQSNVYFATTNSTVANQEIFAIPVANLAGLDFTIISDDTSGNIRNLCKISAIVLGSTVHYNETSTLAVNGYTGDFQVAYNAGNISSGPTVQLLFTPQTSNLMTHKMMITSFNM